MNRRDFLKLCAVMGVGTVATLYAVDIEQVFAEAASRNGGRIHLVHPESPPNSSHTR